MSKKVLLHSIALLTAALMAGLAGCRAVESRDTLPVPATQPPQAPAPQSSAQAPAAASKFDACKLLTKADAEQILGKPVDSPTNPLQGDETYSVDSCEYKVTGGTPLDNVTLIVTVPANGDPARAQAVFNSGKQQAQALYNAAPLDVPGLGDAAYWVGGAGNNLSILKGNIFVSLSASTQKGDSASPALLDLAKVVLGRLP
jgi:hypothetical protein